MKKSNSKIIKFTSAIAAVLAVTIAIGAIYCTPKKDTEHPFLLTVNAAEITPETYIEMGNNLPTITGSSSYKEHSKIDKNGVVQKIDDNWILERSNKEFGINIQCIGENIESITYTANNSYLTYDSYYEGFVSCVSMPYEEIKKYRAHNSSNNYRIASSCTFAYDKQSQSRLDYELSDNYGDGSYPLRMAVPVFFEDCKHLVPNDENINSNIAKNYAEVFNENAENYTLDVTANFKDGTKTTKTLIFRCEYTGTDCPLFYAKELSSEN